MNVLVCTYYEFLTDKEGNKKTYVEFSVPSLYLPNGNGHRFSCSGYLKGSFSFDLYEKKYLVDVREFNGKKYISNVFDM